MDYWILTKDNITEVAARSGRSSWFYEDMMKRQAQYGNVVAVWPEGNQWKSLMINQQYDPHFVMQRYFEKNA